MNTSINFSYSNALRLFVFATAGMISGSLLSSCGLTPSPRYYTKKDGRLPKFIEESHFSGQPNEPSSDESEITKRSQKKIKSSHNIQRSMIEEINLYLGVPYVWGGQNKHGMDCSGFVLVVYHNTLGIKLPHKAALQYKLGKPVKKSSLKTGDLVFFKNTYQWGISHVGIYVSDGKFAHASSGAKKVIYSNLSESYYQRHYAGARRLTGTEK